MADSGRMLNGETEKKLPLHDRLNPEVYPFADRDEVHKGVLRFVQHPRWIVGVGPVKGSGDLPLAEQGVSLETRMHDPDLLLRVVQAPASTAGFVGEETNLLTGRLS